MTRITTTPDLIAGLTPRDGQPIDLPRLVGDVKAAAAPIVEELTVQRELIDAHGGRYVEAYIAHLITGGRRPRAPIGMHSHISEALREMSRDQAYSLRLHGRPKREVLAHG